MDIEANYELFKNKLFITNRNGVDKLLEFIDKTDFKIAPASTKFHLCVEGGLVKHSLNVANFAQIITESLGANILPESLAIASLLHDLCKIHYYTIKQVWDKEYKEATNQWRKIDNYVVEDKFPWGHGEKSVILALMGGIELLPEEISAIRWHMGFSDSGVHFSYPSGQPFRDSTGKNLLTKIIMLADQMAETQETM